ncbi:MAG: choice-of-anchor D domain-containing protein, partial [Kiritimatiellae bacterium]|nr:choice-of-anchor D domain-containing protein [Kiritimatiellia bacterium]
MKMKTEDKANIRQRRNRSATAPLWIAVFLLIGMLGFSQHAAADISEGFESGMPTSYSTGNYSLGSGTWYLQNCIRGTTRYAGSYSCQIRSSTGAQAITPTLSGGVGTISFWVYSSTSSGGLQVNISENDGSSWSAASGSPFTGLTSTWTYKEITVNNSSVNKVQFYRTGATIYLDEVSITSYGGATAPEIAVLGTNLAEIASGDHTPAASDGTDFGSVVNGSAVTNTFTITNLTTATANLILTATPSIALNGSNAFTIVTQPASTSIAAGATTTFKVKFAPAEYSTTYTSMVTVANNDSDEGTYVFKIQGSSPAAPAPEMAILGTNLAVIADGDSLPAVSDGTDFGSISTAVAVTNTFTITNSGSANLTLTNPTITGHVAFTVAANPSTPVSAGGSTTFKIKFAPTVPGMTYTAVVSVANNDSDEHPYNFSITGTADCFTDVTGVYVNPTNELNFTLNWPAVSGASGYVVDVSTNEEFGGSGG